MKHELNTPQTTELSMLGIITVSNNFEKHKRFHFRTNNLYPQPLQVPMKICENSLIAKLTMP